MAAEARRGLGDIPDTLPVRGVPGGWQDRWDDPCPAIVARVLMERELVTQRLLAGLIRDHDTEAAEDGPYGSILEGLDLDPSQNDRLAQSQITRPKCQV